MRAVGAAAALTMLAAAAGARQSPASEPAPDPAQGTSLDKLPPAVRLGVRAELLRRSLPVASTVVVVDRGDDYLAALSEWSMAARFPVLIDDGTNAAREHIARFVRAFEPARVVRWRAPDRAERAPAPTIEAIGAVVGEAWDAAPGQSARERWSELGFFPPGIVAVSMDDPAWTAGAALAAGRGQLLVGLAIDPVVGRHVGGSMQQAHFDAMDAQIVRALDAAAAPWRELGDMIETITLCLNTPTKLAAEPRPLAITDRLGRHADGSRWGWAGQVHGTEAEAAYRAMCALFLQPRRAWLFDGYKDEAPFNQYDVAPAAAALAQANLDTIVDDQPRAERDDWRRRATRPIDAGLVMINTSGNREWFDLGVDRTRAFTSDVPALASPAIVHFIHSFSAQNISDRNSIAARWLEGGAYAYVGSVDEPYLTAFQTQLAFAQRLLAPAPLGAAARQDGGPVWKVNVLGDPLITLASPGLRTTREDPGENGAQPRRIEDHPNLPGARALDEPLAEALRARRFEESLTILIMMGRDADATRLAEAVMRDQPDGWTAAAALIALPTVFRTGQADLFLRVYASLAPEAAADTLNVDLLWLMMRQRLAATTDPAAVDLMRARIRPATLGEDGVAVARALRRVRGADAARALLAELMPTTDDQRHLRELRRELTRLGG